MCTRQKPTAKLTETLVLPVDPPTKTIPHPVAEIVGVVYGRSLLKVVARWLPGGCQVVSKTSGDVSNTVRAWDCP